MGLFSTLLEAASGDANSAAWNKKYGKDFLIFQAPGVVVYHYGDEERQVIFRGADVKKFVPVFRVDGEFAIGRRRDGEPYHVSEKYASAVDWVIKNAKKFHST